MAVMSNLAPTKVLLVDDDPHIRQLLAFAFGKAGMDAVEATDGEEALARVAAEQPDIVVLDINMPRMDGLEVCRRLRAEGQVPILFLSSRDDEIDRVLGIELGGDDYVVKPFSPREVVARAKAILRRTGHAGGASAEQADGGAQVVIGPLLLDISGWSARWHGAEVDLTVTEFTLLRTLASGPTRFFGRDQLIDRLHGPGFAITDRTIDSHVRNLRRKFAEAGCDHLVETKPGVGYRLGPIARGPGANA